jgi:hypothetical protein
MVNLNRFLPVALVFGAMLCPMSTVAGQSLASEEQVSVTTTVTILGPKFTAPPPVSKSDVVVYTGKTRLDVVHWVPVRKETVPLQLAVVIDNDASNIGVGSQLREIGAFIRSQPRNTSVGLFYAVNGTVETASSFSTNHEATAKALRPPVGLREGESPSVYVSISDLLKNHWPATGGRRELLLISTGVDHLDPGPDSLYVHAAIDDAQKAGVVVHTIFTGTSLAFGTSFRGDYAQANLANITDRTGGFNFYEGLITPVSFAPYLQQLNKVLYNQYLLTFTIERTKKREGELREIAVRTEDRNLQIKYPKQVLVPGSGT